MLTRTTCGGLTIRFTTLHVAAEAGQVGMVRLLLDAGALAHRPASRDISTREERWDGMRNFVQTENALHVASSRGHVDVIKEITKRHPLIVNSAAEDTGYTALHYAAENQVASIDALVEAGADLETVCRFRVGNALHVATESVHNVANVLALLGHGAKADPLRHGKKTPLRLAVETGHVWATKVLVSAGADASGPLLFASAKPSSDEIITALAEGGADFNTKREYDGNTPLHLAVEQKLKSNVEALLEAGADETAVNHQGETPLGLTTNQEDDDAEMWYGSDDEEEDMRTLLIYAPKDRARRAWSRRGFFVMCRAFPERVRLQPLSQDVGAYGSCTAASPTSDNPSISRENTNG